MNNLLMNTLSAVALVVILIFGISLLYKKKRRSSGLIELVEYRSFGQKLAVAAMRINKNVFILGITPNDMKVLDKIDEGVLTTNTKLVEQKDSISEKIKRLKEMKEGL